MVCCVLCELILIGCMLVLRVCSSLLLNGLLRLIIVVFRFVWWNSLVLVVLYCVMLLW